MVHCARCCKPMSRVSVWLPKSLVERARRLAPRRKRSDLGGILAEALWDYVDKLENAAIDREVGRMAKDEQFLKAMNAPYPRPPERPRR